MIYVIACVAAIAGLLTGYGEGIITATTQPLRQVIVIAALEEGLLSTTVPLGALLGAVVGAVLGAAFGRRVLLIVAAAMFLIGPSLCAVASDFVLFAIGRFIIGLAIGIGAVMAPAYIAESATERRRGLLVGLYPVAYTLGILAAYLAGVAYADQWRWLFASAAVPGLVLLVWLWRLPSSPRMMVLAGREKEAGLLIARLQGWKSRDPRPAQIIAAIRRASRADSRYGTWLDLLLPGPRMALLAGIGLFFFQQMTGIAAAMRYAPGVFADAGLEHGSAQVATVVGFCVLNLLAMLGCLLTVDTVGRRRLLVLGFGGAAASLAILALAAAVGTGSVQVVAFMGLALYAVSFGLAIGPVPWIVAAEVFPLNLRGAGIALSTISNWVFGFLALASLPALEPLVGFPLIFMSAAVMSLLAIWFSLRCVPDCAGRTLEDIEQEVRAGRGAALRLRPDPAAPQYGR
ncbi:MAG: sugar porter family MFS transporter [Pseudomonadota bacterium]